jgi:hypothetical protein
MRTALARPLATLAAALTLAACGAAPDAPLAPTPPAVPTSPAAPNEVPDPGLIRFVDVSRYDLTDRTIALGCLDGTESETVLLTGGIVDRYTQMQLPTGTVVARHQSMPDGLRGFGLTTGHEYDVLTRTNTWDIYADRGVLGVHREQWQIRDRTTGAVFGLTYTVRYAMDADRNVIAHREQERVVCR